MYVYTILHHSICNLHSQIFMSDKITTVKAEGGASNEHDFALESSKPEPLMTRNMLKIARRGITTG